MSYVPDTAEIYRSEVYNGVKYRTNAEETAEIQLNMTRAMMIEMESYNIVMSLIGIMIIIPNLAVVISSGLLMKKRLEPRCTYLLLGNISLADLFIGAILLIGGCSKTLPIWNHVVCCWTLVIYLTSTMASVYSVGLISLDRFLYILHGMKYHRMMFLNRVRQIIVAMWLFGSVVGIVTIFVWPTDSTTDGQVCWIVMIVSPEGIIFTACLGTIPIIFTVVLYSIILKNAIKNVIRTRNMMIMPPPTEPNHEQGKSLRFFRGGSSSVKTISGSISSQGTISSSTVDCAPETTAHPPPESSSDSFIEKLKRQSTKVIKCESLFVNREAKKITNVPSRWKAIKVVLFTTGGLIVTCAPYIISTFFLVYCEKEMTPVKCHYMKISIVSRLGMVVVVNSFLNPLIYAWWHKGFRKSIVKIYKKKVQKNTFLSVL